MTGTTTGGTTAGTAGSTAAAQRIAQGYRGSGASVAIGSVVVDGTCVPSAHVALSLSMFTRHGLVAGATGTGKTRTVQLLVEGLSAAGVPVVVPDVKGDLSGLGAPGTPDDRVRQRASDTDDDWSPAAVPVEFLSLAGAGTAVPVRATVDSFGPILLAKVLGLNATQESTLGLVLHFAEQRGLPLLDLADLRAVLMHLTSAQGRTDLAGLGGVSASTTGVILRAVTTLAAQGGDQFFGEPELDVTDLLRRSPDGRGVVSVLRAAELQTRPALFSAFLVWLLAELFERLPEVGDVERPELVLVFDEAHLVFADATKAFRQSVTQTVKLIRSKGVGVFFCTQLPTDLPAPVLSQLGARVQHAVRAFTPQDQEALASTVKTYPTTADYDLSTALTALGTGEAVVTVLSETGAPTPVAWTRVRAPRSSMSPLPAAEVDVAVAASPLQARYGTAVDRASAYEMLTDRLAGDLARPPDPPVASPPASTPTPTSASWPELHPPDNPYLGTAADDLGPPPPAPSGGLGDLLANPVVTSFMRSFGSALGGALGRSVSGTRRRRRR